MVRRSLDGMTKSARAARDEEHQAEHAVLAKPGYLCRVYDGIADFFLSVELTALWRLHLVYGKRDGKELITLFTQRFASLSTVMTLLIGSQLGTLFAPGTANVREALGKKDYDKAAFWAGISLMLGLIVSVTALLAILTAWSLNAVVASNNAHLLFRSSLWLYGASLPIRLAVISIYLFFITLCLLFFSVAAWEWALPLTIVFFLFVGHVTSYYSVLGRVIMHSGAIGDEHIMERNIEYELSPTELSLSLVEKSKLAQDADIPVQEEYRIKYQEQLDILEEGGSLRLSDLRLPEEEYLGSEYGDNDENDGNNNNDSKED